MNKMHCWQHYM